MPLIILGLLVVIGIVLYALVQYGNSGDEDGRPVRERYPHAFPPKKDVKDIFDVFTKLDDDADAAGSSGRSSDAASGAGNGNGAGNGDGHTIRFPDNAELEKRKRNIH